jgi:hypothetical protein
MEERRRSPRHPVDHNNLATIPSGVAVQVLDISATGVLLQSSRLFDVGTRGCLRLNVSGSPFSADVEVRRSAAIGDAGYRLGAMFVGISPEDRHIIERFINQ